MNKTINKLVPNFIKEQVRIAKAHFELNKLVSDDKRRFETYSGSITKKSNYDNVRSEIMYFTHQIEKGLSHEQFRKGFGEVPIKNLVISLKKIRSFPNWEQDDFYQNAISALKAYKDKHLEFDEGIPNFEFIPNSIKKEIDACNLETSGIIQLSLTDKNKNKNCDFKSLALNRYSIREFNDDISIDMDDLKEAIEISMKSPSVCNRQPSRVKIIQNKEIMKRVLALQGGFNGYSLPDKLLLVTSDVSVFLRSQERNQSFVDGGLFSMSLMYALEYNSIGACPLSTNISRKNSEEIREILSIPDKENLIMFIACGMINDSTKCGKSYRIPAENITTII